MIVVFGSLNADLLMRVARLPVPGETVICDGYVVRAGGKGSNQAVAAAHAGAEVRMFGRVGDDPFGRLLLDNLDARSVDRRGVVVCDRPTGCATVAIDDQGENLIVVAAGANAAARAADVPDGLLVAGTTLLLQMEVPVEENWRILRRARARGARTVLNFAPARALDSRGFAGIADSIDCLIVNRGEAKALAGALRIAASDDDAAALSRLLAARSGGACVVTLGGEGAVAASQRNAWRVGSLPVTVADTTGAGDTFCGVFAAALDAGQAFAQALHAASVGAALACEKLGAQEGMPTAAAIDARLAELPAPVLIS